MKKPKIEQTKNGFLATCPYAGCGKTSEQEKQHVAQAAIRLHCVRKHLRPTGKSKAGKPRHKLDREEQVISVQLRRCPRCNLDLDRVAQLIATQVD